MLQMVFVQQQRLEVHEPGDRRGQRLEQIITEYECVEIVEQPDGVRDLGDQISAERQQLQAAGKRNGFSFWMK